MSGFVHLLNQYITQVQQQCHFQIAILGTMPAFNATAIQNFTSNSDMMLHSRDSGIAPSPILYQFGNQKTLFCCCFYLVRSIDPCTHPCNPPLLWQLKDAHSRRTSMLSLLPLVFYKASSDFQSYAIGSCTRVCILVSLTRYMRPEGSAACRCPYGQRQAFLHDPTPVPNHCGST